MPRITCSGMLIRGEATDDIDERGRTPRGTAILLLLNGGARSRTFTLPAMEQPGRMDPDTQYRAPAPARRPRKSGASGRALPHAPPARGDAVTR